MSCEFLASAAVQAGTVRSPMSCLTDISMSHKPAAASRMSSTHSQPSSLAVSAMQEPLTSSHVKHSCSSSLHAAAPKDKGAEAMQGAGSAGRLRAAAVAAAGAALCLGQARHCSHACPPAHKLMAQRLYWRLMRALMRRLCWLPSVIQRLGSCGTLPCWTLCQRHTVRRASMASRQLVSY